MHWRSKAAQFDINRQVFHPQIVRAEGHLPRNVLRECACAAMS
jgi:hypothetical protein